jgi:ribosomal protein L7/L12
MKSIFEKAEEIYSTLAGKTATIRITMDIDDHNIILNERIITRAPAAELSNQGDQVERTFELVLAGHSISNKLGLVKLVKEITNLGLKESKDIVDGTRCIENDNVLRPGEDVVLMSSQDADVFDIACEKLNEVGASFYIRRRRSL